ncbi:MAG: T9SS type A sorting domain-containing protein [Sphingobacteriales bacterium]|nr:MAG: T9SS type A sorting domain-containing protein [Sphingobacteriales bacterium]
MNLRKLLLPVAMAIGALFSGTKQAGAQTVITVGTGTSATSGTNGLPIYRSSASSSFNYSQSASLYTTTDLTSLPNGATITAIAFNKTTNASLKTGRTASFNLLLKNTSNTALNGSTTWSTFTTGATSVYSNATLDSATVAATPWLTFPLSTGFVYTGGSLEIYSDWSINTGTGNPTTAGFSFAYTNTTNIQSVGTSNSASLGTSTTLSSTNTRLNNIQITYTAPAACSGTPTAGTSNASITTTCASNPVTITLSGGTAASGLSYQLQSSPNNTTFTNVGTAATIASFTTTVAAGVTYYRINTTCTSSNQTAASTSIAVTGQGPITTFPYTDTFSNSGLPSCWSASAGSGASYQWTGVASDGTYGASAPQSGSGFLALNVFNAQTAYNPYLLNSRSYTLSGAAKQLQYYYYLGNGGYKGTTGATGSDPYPLTVLGTKDNGATYDTLYRHSTANSVFATGSATSFWTLNTIVLPASYAGQTVSFRFLSISNYGSGFTNQGLDEVTVLNVPSCSPPTGVTVSNITTSGATIGWTASVSTPSSGYQYEVRSSGTAGSGATGLAASGNTAAGVLTANATGLASNTSYTVYVRSNCGSGSFSSWTAGTSVTTLCSPVTTFPYIDTFSNSGLPSCWSASAGSGASYQWTGAASDGTNGVAGPQSGSGFLALNVYNALTSYNPYLLNSRAYTLSGAAKQLQYYYYLGTNGYKGTTGATGSDPYPLTVLGTKDNGATYDTLYRHSTANSVFATSNSTSFWTLNSIVLPASYAGQTVSFRFLSMSNYGSGTTNQGLDEVAVNNVPTCFTPTGVTVSNITNNSATLTWTAPTPTPANGYRYQIRSGNAVVASGTTAAGVTTVNVTGLAANAIDTVFVRSLCSATDSSMLSGAVVFRTICNTTGLPVAEGFNGTSLPSCWSTQLVAIQTGTKISVVSSGSFPTTSPYAGSGMVQYNAYSSTNGGSGSQERLVSLPVSSTGLNTIVTNFYWRNENNSSYTDTTEGMQVQYSTNGTTWVDAGAFIPRHDTSLTAGTAQWKRKTVVLPAAASNQPTLYVGYRFTSKFGDNLFMDSVRIENCVNPVVALGNDTTICSGSGINLNAGNAGSTYLWSTGATTQSIDATTTGTYSVQVTNATGCSGRDTIVVNVSPLPTVNLGNDTAFCSGNTVTLNAGNPNNAYLWSTGATTQTLTASTSGIYSVRVTSPFGCIGRDTVVVTVNPLPVVNLGPDTAICSGNTVTLNAGNPNNAYLWSTGATTQTISVSTAGTYSVRVTNTNGCIGRDTLVLTVNPTPVVNLGADTAICNGSAVTLNAGNAGASYLWSTGATTQTISATAAGTYSVRVTNTSGCIGRDTIVVSINPRPTVNLGNDTSICSGNTVTLNAGNAGASYLWSTGATTQTISVTTAGTYNVRVTNATGCIGRDTLVLIVTPTPVVNLGADTAFCAGNSVTLNAGNAGASYLWSTGATTQTITASTSGTYNVRVTNTSGCIGRDTIVVTVNARPTVNLGNDTTICSGNSVTLNAGNANASYLWSTGATTQTITASTSGSYSVRVTNATGCIGRDTVVLTVNPTPVVNLGADTAICAGSSVTLNAGNAGASYLWSTGATTRTITASTSGSYSVRVTNTSGCIGRDTVVLTVTPQPTVSLGADTAVCIGSNITLDAGNAGALYLWSTGATTQTITVSTAGTYSVRVTNTTGCIGRDTIAITIAPLPTVRLGNDTTVCAGIGVVLNAGNAGASYSWSTGATTQTITATTSGNYSVRVTNATGCSASDTVTVTVRPLPVAGAINVNSQSPTYVFSAAGNQNDSLRGWSFGDGAIDTAGNPTTTRHTYTANGTYTVKFYVLNDCGVDSATAIVVVSGLGVNTVVKEGELKLFPNPASEFVTIQNTSTQVMQHITVLNAVGAVVREESVINGQEQRINISGLAAGTYLVRIQLDGAIVVRRLQITK